MVGTRHCCWGECKTDSRYPEKWRESLKELEKLGQKVFIPFPKLAKDLAKCKRWLVACSWEFFTEKNVNKNTYICALHWPGGKGPTDEFPEREEPVTKQNKVIKENYGEQSDESMEFIPTDYPELFESSTTDAINESTTFDEDQVMCDVTHKHMYENLLRKLVSDQESQTVDSKYELSAKVEIMNVKNKVSTLKLPPPKIVSTLSYENIVRDAVLMKHFTGLTPLQFEVLHNFLDAVCLLESIHYWTRKDCPTKDNARTGPKSDFPSREKLFICLLRLKRGFTVKTLSALLSTPDRKIKPSHVRKIFTTFIQLMYVTFRDMQNFMFPQRAQLSKFLPKVFKTMRKIRCIVDCTEFRVECSRNFVRQGNTFSS